jgi:hypothetical protein
MKIYIRKGNFFHAKNQFIGDVLILDKSKAKTYNSTSEADKTCRLLNQLSDSFDYKTSK